MLSGVSLPEAQVVSLVAYLLIRLSTPPAASATILVLLTRFTNVKLPTWYIVLLSIASLPACLMVRVLYVSWHIERKAARLGATLPPRLKGLKFGNIDILATLSKGFETDYLSK